MQAHSSPYTGTSTSFHRAAGLGELVEPMVWAYVEDIDRYPIIMEIGEEVKSKTFGIRVILKGLYREIVLGLNRSSNVFGFLRWSSDEL
jgi:hypothetical protein